MFQVACLPKATPMGEELSTSPHLTTLLCLLFVVFSFVVVIYYIDFCQAFNEMMFFDFFFSIVFKSKNVKEIFTKRNLQIYD